METGIMKVAISPRITMRIDVTNAILGRLMKISNIMD